MGCGGGGTELFGWVVLAERVPLEKLGPRLSEGSSVPVVCKGVVWEQKESGTKEV